MNEEHPGDAVTRDAALIQQFFREHTAPDGRRNALRFVEPAGRGYVVVLGYDLTDLPPFEEEDDGDPVTYIEPGEDTIELAEQTLVALRRAHPHLARVRISLVYDDSGAPQVWPGDFVG